MSDTTDTDYKLPQSQRIFHHRNDGKYVVLSFNAKMLLYFFKGNKDSLG